MRIAGLANWVGIGAKRGTHPSSTIRPMTARTPAAIDASPRLQVTERHAGGPVGTALDIAEQRLGPAERPPRMLRPRLGVGRLYPTERLRPFDAQESLRAEILAKLLTSNNRKHHHAVIKVEVVTRSPENLARIDRIPRTDLDFLHVPILDRKRRIRPGSDDDPERVGVREVIVNQEGNAMNHPGADRFDPSTLAAHKGQVARELRTLRTKYLKAAYVCI